MNIRIPIASLSQILLLQIAITQHAQAEEIRIPVSTQGNPSLAIPERGQSQTEVARAFGEPDRATGMVGKPPISTWHYEDFSVYFEEDRVIHAVRRHRSL